MCYGSRLSEVLWPTDLAGFFCYVFSLVACVLFLCFDHRLILAVLVFVVGGGRLSRACFMY